MKNIKLIVADWEKVSPANRDDIEQRTAMKMAERDGKADYRRICGCCGREIKDLSKSHSLHLIEGAEYWTEYEGTINECHGADMGWWTVGNTCYNKFKKNSYEVEIVNEDE